MKNKNIIYYEKETDEVINHNVKRKIIDEKYKYIHTNPIYKFWSSFSYYIFAIPYAFITFKLINKIKFHNLNLIKNLKEGCFIYANHTNKQADAFAPALICAPNRPHIIVNSVNVSFPFIGKLANMWGAIPIPETISATRNFYSKIKKVLDSNNPIVIYPEAHLWPYFTKIRDFSSTSFFYPIKFNKPVFTFTTVYTKRKLRKKPKIEIYIDGPFYPNKNLPTKLAQEELKSVVYNTLNNRADLSNYEYIKYIKKEN